MTFAWVDASEKDWRESQKAEKRTKIQKQEMIPRKGKEWLEEN